jgi:recombinational DNA repair protein (RecF pathway)
VTVAVMPQALPSRYVRRCVQCRQVRGVSGMSRKHPDVCRFCAEQAIALAAQKRRLLRGYADLRARERELAEKLDWVRRKIRLAESEMLNVEQPDLLPVEPVGRRDET